MQHRTMASHPRRSTGRLTADLALIAEAIVDAFRALIPSPVESRASQFRQQRYSF